MGRPKSEKVKLIQQRLIARLRQNMYHPGDRFLSNRAIAEQFEVSYQTADRIVRELVNDGFLERRAASGTYVPGQRRMYTGAQLIFHPRARRKASFGARLLFELTSRLNNDGIDWRMTWAKPDQPVTLSPGRYPVIWEAQQAVRSAEQADRAALLLNQRPAAGLGAVLLDSVSVDDFYGGACAAQLLTNKAEGKTNLAILSGPKDDPRSQARVAGFFSVTPATVISSPTWFLEGGLTVATRALKAGKDGLFCCNDRLAEAVIRWSRDNRMPPPPLVGFDDAPVAQWLGLTTIAIPWRELVSAAAGVIQRRLGGDISTGITQMIATRPIIRESTEAS